MLLLCTYLKLRLEQALTTTVTLVATQSAKQVVFEGTAVSSFNKGITVQAAAGIVLSQGVSTGTKPSATMLPNVLSAGTTLTVSTGKALSILQPGVQQQGNNISISLTA